MNGRFWPGKRPRRDRRGDCGVPGLFLVPSQARGPGPIHGGVEVEGNFFCLQGIRRSHFTLPHEYIPRSLLFLVSPDTPAYFVISGDRFASNPAIHYTASHDDLSCETNHPANRQHGRENLRHVQRCEPSRNCAFRAETKSMELTALAQTRCTGCARRRRRGSWPTSSRS